MSARPDPASFSARHHRLAAQIVEIVRMRGLQEGAHLTAVPIAEALNVSRTPVLRAFELLASLGALSHLDNRGYFVADLSVLDEVAFITDEDRLYWRLVNDRIDGHLPDTVDETGLMRRYEAGRWLISKVLARLAEEDVLSRRTGLGWAFHPPPTAQEAAAAVRYRLLLEPAAFAEPTFFAPRDELAAIIAEQESLAAEADTPGRSVMNFDRNAGFHETVARWSGNVFLAKAVRRHNKRRRLMQYRHFVRPARIRTSAEEHLGVLTAIADGDLELARTRLHKHIEQAPISARALSGAAQR